MSDVDYEQYLKSESWRKIVGQRLKIDRYTCQMCGTHGSTTNPLECHHFSYKNLGNEDVYKDLVIVCHSCHGMLSKLMNRVVDESGRKGWTNKAIPRISVYTISGFELEQRKEQLNAKAENS